jgi:hypothetical protein
MLQPLAIAIVTGLVVQLPLVLGVLPALLSMFRSAPEPRHAAVTFASSSYA